MATISENQNQWWKTPENGEFFSKPENTSTPPLFNNFPQQQTPVQVYTPQTPEYLSDPINPTTKGILRGIVDLKTQFADNEAYKNYYGGLLNSGNLNEEQAKEVQERIGLLNFQQSELNKAANFTRNAARALNIDTTGFNEDNTLEESQQNMYNIDARSVRNLMNLPSVREQQQKHYDDLRSVGLSPRLARIAANQMHDQYRENNVNQLWSGLQDYGFNSDGSINQFGTMLIGRLADENPQMATLFSNLFASPKDAYGEANATYRQNLALNNQRQAQLANMQHDFAKLAAIQNFDWEKHNDTQEYNANQKAIEAEQKAKERQLEMYFKSPEYAVASAFKIGQMLYGDDTEKVSNFVRSQFSKGNVSQEDEKRQSAKNIFDGESLRIKSALKNGDFEGANQIIDSVLMRLADTEKDYAGHITLDDHMYNYKMLDYYRKVANQEMTYEQMERAMNEMQGKPFIGNVEENLADLRNNPKKLNRLIDQELARRRNAKQNSTDSPVNYNGQGYNTLPPRYSLGHGY